MIECYRLLVARLDELGPDWNYPIHLGVTEAGEGEDGRIKSAIGIGSLLCDGLGDTIRVSLTEDSPREIAVCTDLLAQIPCLTVSRTDFLALKSAVAIPIRHCRSLRSLRLHRAARRRKSPLDRASQMRRRADRARRRHPRHLGQSRPENPPQGRRASPRRSMKTSTFSRSIRRGDFDRQLRHAACDGQGRRGAARHRGLPPAGRQAQSAWAATIPFCSRTACDFEPAPLEPKIALLRAAVVIGSLLADGIGDAILVRGESGAGQSLRLAYNILQAAGCRSFKTDYVACPSCGRTLFNLQTVTARIKERTAAFERRENCHHGLHRQRPRRNGRRRFRLRRAARPTRSTFTSARTLSNSTSPKPRPWTAWWT